MTNPNGLKFSLYKIRGFHIIHCESIQWYRCSNLVQMMMYLGTVPIVQEGGGEVV